MTIRILFIIFVFILQSCDKGLSPELADINPGFGGTITFIGDWNKEVTRTHVVLFKSPLLSKEDFNAFNLKYVSDSIATESSTYNYNTNDESLLSNISPDSYSYLAVAQSKTEALSLNREDWEIVGLYYHENDSTKPGVLEIPEDSFVNNINIICDFNNPPPQPPGGDSFDNILNSAINSHLDFLKKLNRDK
ncbi:MAG: hypothetical protein GY936_02775 [Ignavibacteriae bacterium]|nr:hypothetical protein [Ignavibacteriota bacterium]